MVKYTESSIALYDLKVDFLYNNPVNKSNGYQYYFFEKQLKSGLKIKVRADGYYVFDFYNSLIAKPVKYTDFGNNLYIRNERVEVLHAFLACLRHVTQKHAKLRHTFHMNFLDNYIICSSYRYDLDEILSVNDANAFSTGEYMELCKIKLTRMQSCGTNSVINSENILLETCNVIDNLMQNDSYAVYILGILYRAAAYHKLGLELHSAIFTRSVFEWLATRHLSNIKSKEKKEAYEALLFKHQVVDKDGEMMKSLRNIRGNAVHKLIFPKQHSNLENPISRCFKIIEGIFNKEFNVNINIPLGQSQFQIIEEY